jgi:hypothetical protein
MKTEGERWESSPLEFQPIAEHMGCRLRGDPSDLGSIHRYAGAYSAMQVYCLVCDHARSLCTWRTAVQTSA